MQILMRQFNLYFVLAIGLAVFCGCQSDKHKSSIAILRVHLETPPDRFDTTKTISILRVDPVTVTVAKEPLLAEGNIVAAKIIEARGGFAIQIKFDEASALMFEQYCASNPGKHFVIFGQWGEKASEGRWLAAPLISHRISNGILSFTPDASREESQDLVDGINRVTKKLQKNSLNSLLR
jgi:hypothetical protein